MLFEEFQFGAQDIATAQSNYYVDEPIGEDQGSSGSIQFTDKGFVVVGAEYVSAGQMMLISDGQGNALGIAFDNGDGDWTDEISAVASGLGCVGGVGATAVSDGTVAVFTGIATAGVCAEFVNQLGNLYSDYHDSGSSQNYTQSVTVFFTEQNGWDMVYTYTYPDQGSWKIYYDDETGTWSDWVWDENVKQNG